MPDREPYDFSALAPDFGDLEAEESSASARAPNLFAVASSEDDDFEAEMERLASEEEALALDETQVDAEFQALQRALADLSETVIDADLDAEEAWLEQMLNEGAGPPP